MGSVTVHPRGGMWELSEVDKGTFEDVASHLLDGLANQMSEGDSLRTPDISMGFSTSDGVKHQVTLLPEDIDNIRAAMGDGAAEAIDAVRAAIMDAMSADPVFAGMDFESLIDDSIWDYTLHGFDVDY